MPYETKSAPLSFLKCRVPGAALALAAKAYQQCLSSDRSIIRADAAEIALQAQVEASIGQAKLLFVCGEQQITYCNIYLFVFIHATRLSAKQRSLHFLQSTRLESISSA